MYGAWYNLGGLGHTEPLKLRYEEPEYEDESGTYWVDEGDMKNNFEFETIGLQVGSGVVKFSSESCEEVQAFIYGVRATSNTKFCPPLEENFSYK